MSANAYSGFRPMHEAHAIEQVVISVQFERPLADDAIRAGIAALDRFRQDLPAKQDLVEVGFRIGPGGMDPMRPPASFDGQARYVTNNAGLVLKELRLERQAIVFRSQSYTRWPAMWSEVSAYMESLLSSSGSTGVAAFSLQYVNKFVWMGPPASCRCTSLLQVGSAHVAPRIFDSEDLWHCHSGRFIRRDNKTQRLEVVDLDCYDEELQRQGGPAEQTRVVRISTSLSDRFNRPSFEAYELPAQESIEVANVAFGDLHARLKSVFSEIISSDIAMAIGMNDDNAS